MIDTAISLCSPLLTPQLPAMWPNLIEEGERSLQRQGLPAARRIYLGNDSCDFLLCRNRSRLEETAAAMRDRYPVTLVTPPVSQEMLQDVLGLLTHFEEAQLADEIAVQDLGLLAWAGDHLKHMRIHAGRLLDKTMREARFDPFTVDEVARNRVLYETPYVRQNALGDFLASRGVRDVELDCVPGAVLDLSDSDPDWNYVLWYPYVALSWCSTCEFAAGSVPASEKFVPGHCSQRCTEYSTELCGRSLLKITKRARLLEAVEDRSVMHCFRGNCRIVISAGMDRSG